MNKNRIDIVATVKARFKELEKLNGKLMRMNQIQAQARVQNNRLARTMVNGFNKSSTEVVRFNGNLLSLLFFGMEMKRIFGGALKSIFEGYKKAIPENHRFNQLTTQLSANWEFFKFQLADALAQSPFFQKFVNIAIKILRVFKSLPTPVKELIGWLLVIGAILGGVLMAVGVIGLGVTSLINLWAAMSGSKAIGAVVAGIKAIKTKIGAATIASKGFVATWALPIAAVLLLGYLWKKFVDKFGSDIGLQTDQWWEYIVVFVGAFVNGIATIGLAILKIPGFFLDVMVNILKAAGDFAKSIADMVAAAFDPRKTVKDQWDTFLSEQITRFSNPDNYGIVTGLDAVRDKISAATLSVTSDLVNKNNQPQQSDEGTTLIVVNNGVQGAVDEGVLTQSQLDMIMGSSNGDYSSGRYN